MSIIVASYLFVCRKITIQICVQDCAIKISRFTCYAPQPLCTLIGQQGGKTLFKCTGRGITNLADSVEFLTHGGITSILHDWAHTVLSTEATTIPSAHGLGGITLRDSSSMVDFRVSTRPLRFGISFHIT